MSLDSAASVMETGQQLMGTGTLNSRVRDGKTLIALVVTVEVLISLSVAAFRTTMK